MARCWVLYLLIGMVSTHKTKLVTTMTHEKTVIAAIKQYNSESLTRSLYRLVKADPVPNWDPTSKTYQLFSLIIRESMFPRKVKKPDTQTCEFKSDGKTKVCTAKYHYVEKEVETKVECKKA